MGSLVLVKVARWIAAAIAFGWLATVASLAVPGGHPPMWWVVGAGVVLVSFVIAPIGAGAALAELWRARREGLQTPRPAMTALGLNLLFLVVAVGLYFGIRWLATRR